MEMLSLNTTNNYSRKHTGEQKIRTTSIFSQSIRVNLYSKIGSALDRLFGTMVGPYTFTEPLGLTFLPHSPAHTAL
jgi:hypothetical protein